MKNVLLKTIAAALTFAFILGNSMFTAFAAIDATEENKLPKGLVIGIVVVCVCIVAAVIVLTFVRKKKN